MKRVQDALGTANCIPVGKAFRVTNAVACSSPFVWASYRLTVLQRRLWLQHVFQGYPIRLFDILFHRYFTPSPFFVRDILVQCSSCKIVSCSRLEKITPSSLTIEPWHEQSWPFRNRSDVIAPWQETIKTNARGQFPQQDVPTLTHEWTFRFDYKTQESCRALVPWRWEGDVRDAKSLSAWFIEWDPLVKFSIPVAMFCCRTRVNINRCGENSKAI